MNSENDAHQTKIPMKNHISTKTKIWHFNQYNIFSCALNGMYGRSLSLSRTFSLSHCHISYVYSWIGVCLKILILRPLIGRNIHHITEPSNFSINHIHSDIIATLGSPTNTYRTFFPICHWNVLWHITDEFYFSHPANIKIKQATRKLCDYLVWKFTIFLLWPFSWLPILPFSLYPCIRRV